MSIYFDNAATTPLDPEVFKAITPYLLNHFGNPSSHHQQGREAKKAIENSRKTIAGLINASPEEIIFTSGGTEADNMAILSAVWGEGITHVITTQFEHHAVLRTLQNLQQKGRIKINYIRHDQNGTLDLDHLELLLQENPRSLVSVMHANNEIGNLNDVEQIGIISEQYNALFHTDTVQTMGHYHIDLQKLKIHFLTASAHKFHGPKGIGFLYCKKGIKAEQIIHGGSQENGKRAGTENIPGIIGLTKALEMAYEDLEQHHQHIQKLKNRMIAGLTQLLPEIRFNGNSAIAHQSLYTILSVSIASTGLARSLICCLDELNIAVSGGSACSTGSVSHVLRALGINPDLETVRFSFSRMNTLQEVDLVIEQLSSIYQTVAA